MVHIFNGTSATFPFFLFGKKCSRVLIVAPFVAVASVYTSGRILEGINIYRARVMGAGDESCYGADNNSPPSPGNSQDGSTLGLMGFKIELHDA